MNGLNTFTALSQTGFFALALDPTAPRRYWKPEPPPTGRYVKWLSMDPVEDPRLGHGAARLLQVIRSLAGRANWIETTQAGLAKRINRSARQIQRYLNELQRFGYIRSDMRWNRAGMIAGLYLYLTRKVLPAFKDKRRGEKPGIPDTTELADSKVKQLSDRDVAKLPEDLARALISLGNTLATRTKEPGGGAAAVSECSG